jgi:hypothetical protein
VATIHLGSVDDGSSQPKRDKRVTTRSHGLTEYLRDSRHNLILKQQLRRYWPRSIFLQKSPFRGRFGAFYPYPAHKSAPRAAWATHSGHCSPASRPTRGVRDVFYRVQPISASDRRAPTIEFTIRLGLMAGWEPDRSPGTTKRAQLKPVDAHWQGEATTGSKPPPPRPTGAGRCLRATFAQPGHRKRPPRRPWRGGEPRRRGPVEQRSSRARVDQRPEEPGAQTISIEFCRRWPDRASNVPRTAKP